MNNSVHQATTWFISPCQCRMARAALKLSLRDLAAAIGVSAMAVSYYESSNFGKLGADKLTEIAQYFQDQGVFFGPCDAVSVRQDVFKQDAWFISALFQLLQEHGLMPGTQELIAASRRAKESG